MINIKKRNALITAVLLAMAVTGAGQPSIEMNFQGALTDGGGQKIANEQFDITVKLMSAEPGKTDLWSHNASTETDEEGWFSFSVPEISEYLVKPEKPIGFPCSRF